MKTFEQQTHTVRAGESFWTIAEAHVTTTQPSATESEISRYWRLLVETNESKLPVDGVPDLLYPGTVLDMPLASGS